MIDDIFNLIINKSNAIPIEFYHCLDRLELLYTSDMIQNASIDVQMIKEITYTLYDIYNSRLKNLLLIFRRSTLITIYNICKDAEDKEKVENFLAYYKKSVINKYTENMI